MQRFTEYTKQALWWYLCASQDKRSFYEQFADLKGSTDLSVLDSAYPKPSLAALSKAPTAQKMPLSDVTTCQVQRPLLAAVPKTMTSEQAEDVQTFNFFWRTVGFVLVHGIFFSVSGSGPVQTAQRFSGSCRTGAAGAGCMLYICTRPQAGQIRGEGGGCDQQCTFNPVCCLLPFIC
mgnify:CR=1 FL=1